jgi:glycosyltransferase involved in cell wall biosynthesis
MSPISQVKPKILIFILAYNAKDHIVSLLDRIPETYWLDRHYDSEILVVDDASSDDTTTLCTIYGQRKSRHLRVLRNPLNQGYGGNQKIGYTYAIENGFNIVVMLHGDGQYPPEYLDNIIAPLVNAEADAVFGSRMLRKSQALEGGMPRYKFVGNILLTWFQNKLLGSTLSEFHSGYRAYRVSALENIPFHFNSNDFDFDTDIIIQALDTSCRIREIPIPTHYGDEICHVNGFKYAFQIARSTLLSRIQSWGIYYNPKFDYASAESPYEAKTHFDSSHRFAIDEAKDKATVLDIGCGDGHVARALCEQKQCTIFGYDIRQSNEALHYCKDIYVTDLNRFDWSMIKPADTVLLLDIVEHLDRPETFLQELRRHSCKYRPDIILTTGNVAFILVRLSFLIGQFNYGKRGILDLDHKRLFTFASLRRLLQDQGYEIIKMEGIPVPIPFILGDTRLASFLLSLNRLLIKVSRGLFAFQIAVVARPLPTLEQLLLQAEQEGRSRMKQALAASSGHDSTT